MFKKAKIRNFCRFLCSLCGAIFSAVGVLQNAAAYSCAPGQYVNQNGGCTACPVGCWCVPGQNAATTTVTSVANMCSPSSTTYTGGTHGGENLGGGGAFKCPAGFSLSSASSDSATDCYGYVDSGYYIHSSGFKSASTYSCPVGSYCPGGTYYSGLNGGDHGVYACPDHSTTASKTSSSINQCICDSGYYMNGSNCVSVGVDYYRIYPDNSRYACSVNATTNGSTSASYCTCKTGYSGGGGQSDRSGSNCELVKPVIALQSNGATSVGTTAIYATYNTGVYSDPARTRPMSTNSKITTPIKTGYTFRGYYNSTIGTAQYINNSGYITTAGVNAATGYTSLGPYNWYAQWNEIDYTITYNLNGGTNPSAPPTSYSIESSAINLPTPTRDGYIFTGWYDNSSLTGSAVTTIPTGSTGNKEYWAKWEMSYPFSLTTTSMTANDTFKFSISASGNFVVDCGDNGVLSGDGVSGNKITRSNTTMAQYTCTYPTAGTHTIRFGGTATGYNATSGASSSYAAIGFSTSNYSGNTPNKIAGISGSLGAIFGTIGTGNTLATQPRFMSTFNDCSGLTGSIPENLFAGISGAPAANMFDATFIGCSGLTGSIPENLFAGISGAPALRMFSHTFHGCSGLTGSIPENLFAGISGAPATSMFYGTFEGCSGLTGSIPGNLFAGISGKPADWMFNNTFYNCSGLTGSIPENLFAGISGAPALEMFLNTFYGCSGLTGSIPGNLFAGISGAPKSYMFNGTFEGCSGLTGSIPETLFAGITGAPAQSMFSGTFQNCSGLTGSIPGNLFAGITGAPAKYMFYETFYNCSGLTGVTDGTNTTTYIPVDFLSGITTSASPTNQAPNMFTGTGLASTCPSGTYNVTRSQFTNAGKPWCTPCPDGTTSPAGATSVDQCILIEQYECENGGGTWDEESGTCMTEQEVCENEGGTWDDENGVCISADDEQGLCEYDGGTWHEECGVCETMDECADGWDDATCACIDPQTECENNGGTWDEESGTCITPQEECENGGGTWHEECGVCETMDECEYGWDDATCSCIDPQTECEDNGGTWDEESGTCMTEQEVCENEGGTWHDECGVCETMDECEYGWDDATCACIDPQTECDLGYDDSCGMCYEEETCGEGEYWSSCQCVTDCGDNAYNSSESSGSPEDVCECTYGGVYPECNQPQDCSPYTGTINSYSDGSCICNTNGYYYGNDYTNCTYCPPAFVVSSDSTSGWDNYITIVDPVKLMQRQKQMSNGSLNQKLVFGYNTGNGNYNYSITNTTGNSVSYYNAERLQSSVGVTPTSAYTNGTRFTIVLKDSHTQSYNSTTGQCVTCSNGAVYDSICGVCKTSCGVGEIWNSNTCQCETQITCASNQTVFNGQCVDTPFTLTTTNSTTSFSWKMTAAGEFVFDCGVGGTFGDTENQVVTINRINTDEKIYTCDYTNAGAHTIKFGGRATAYSTGYHKAAISFYMGNNRYNNYDDNNSLKIASISGSLGDIFGTLSQGYRKQPLFVDTFANAINMTDPIPSGLFSGISGTPEESMFEGTFFNCRSLTGSIPENLFRGISGNAQYLFYETFRGCSGLTGTNIDDPNIPGKKYALPPNLFVNIRGLPEFYSFRSTFNGCSGLTGTIPENLFSGISGSMRGYSFFATFQNCSHLTGYIPPLLFAGFSKSNAQGEMEYVFQGSGLATSCEPYGLTPYTTGFESYFSGKVSCAPSTPTIITLYQNASADDTNTNGTVNATFNQPMPSASAPTRNGYVFDGYYSMRDGGVKYYNADMSSASNWFGTGSTGALYAHWIVCDTANGYEVVNNICMCVSPKTEDNDICHTACVENEFWNGIECIDLQTQCENEGGTWHEECGVCETMDECADGWDDATCACIDPQTECENNGGYWDTSEGEGICCAGDEHVEAGVCVPDVSPEEQDCIDTGGTWHDECGVCETMDECSDGWDDTACACIDPRTECENGGGTWYDECGMCELPGECAYGWDGATCACTDPQTECESQGPEYYWDGSDCAIKDDTYCEREYGSDYYLNTDAESEFYLTCQPKDDTWCEENYGSDYYWNGSECYYEEPDICPAHSADSQNGIRILSNGALVIEYGEIEDCAQNIVYINNPGSFLQTQNISDLSFENNNVSMMYCLYNAETHNYDGQCTQKAAICSESEAQTLVQMSPYEILQAYINMMNFTSEQMENLMTVFQYTLTSDDIYSRCSVVSDCPTITPKTTVNGIPVWYGSVDDGQTNLLPTYITKYNGECVIPGTLGNNMNNLFYVKNYTELVDMIDNGTQPTNDIKVSPLLELCSTDMTSLSSMTPEQLLEWYQTQLQSNASDGLKNAIKNGYFDSDGFFTLYPASEQTNTLLWLVSRAYRCPITCNAGEYLLWPDGPACDECPIGYYCPAESVTYTASEYNASSELGKTICPDGTTSPAGATSVDQCISIEQTECENDGGTWHDECGVCETMDECADGWDDATCACATDPQTECENNGGYWDTSEGEGICCAGDEHVEAGVCVPDLSPEEQDCIDTGGTWHEECGMCETMDECAYGWDGATCACTDPQTECIDTGGTWDEESGTCMTEQEVCENEGGTWHDECGVCETMDECEYGWDGATCACTDPQTECENNGDYWDAGDSTCKNNAWCEENYGPDYYWAADEFMCEKNCPAHSADSQNGVRILSNGALISEEGGFPLYGNTCINTILYLQNPGNLLQTENISDLSFDNNNVSLMYCIYNAETGNYDGQCTQKAAICSESELQTVEQMNTYERLSAYANMLNLTEEDMQNPMDLLRYTVESDDIYERCGTSVDECPADYFVPSDHPEMCFPHVLHIGDNVVYLKSEKQTTPSLNVNFDGKTWYANMVENQTKISSDSDRYMQIEYNNKKYYVCDDTICGE